MATKLHRDDLLSATLAWVMGKCFEWNLHAQQFVLTFDDQDHRFQDFVHRTHTVVWRYLQGHITLDGTCSDLECTMALEAKRIFGYHLEHDEEKPSVVTPRQMKAAMAWWNALAPIAQQMYREEHPDDFKAADRITRFWLRNFPKTVQRVAEGQSPLN